MKQSLYIIIFSLYSILVIALGLFVFQPQVDFVSFLNLKWTEDTYCEDSVVSSIDGTSLVLPVKTKRHDSIVSSSNIFCKSSSFKITSHVLRAFLDAPEDLDYSTLELAIYSENGRKLISEKVLASEYKYAGADWSPVYIKINPDYLGKRGYLKILPKESGDVNLRSRVEFLSEIPKRTIMSKNEIFNSIFSQEILFDFSVLVLSLFLILKLELSLVSFFTILFFSSSVLFVSSQPFFYFDEWHVIERFKDHGTNGIWKTHGEHFLPVFFGWYYSVVSLFGKSYLLMLLLNMLLHAVHGVVLYRLISTFNFNKKTSCFLILLFSIVALHAEVLEWAFEQSIIICSTLGLASMYFGRKYIEGASKKVLLVSALSLAITPLIFGNGFIWLPIVLMVLLLSTLLGDHVNRSLKFYRFVAQSLLSSLLFVFPVSVYLINTANVSHPAHARPSIDTIILHLDKIFMYIVTGSGLGSFFRGVGIYPNLSLGSVHKFCSELSLFDCGFLNIISFQNYSADFILGCFGYVFVLMLFLISMVFENKKRVIILYLIGGGILVSSFILPALARFEYGELQSLALRYQYQALLGLVFIFLPITDFFLRYLFANRQIRAKKFLFVGKILFTSLVVLWIFLQTVMVNNFNYFKYQGEVHRIYAQSLLDWEDKAGFAKGGKYEGENQFSGLYPLHHPHITIGSHPMQIYETYNWITE